MKRLGQSAITTGSGTLLYTVPTGFKTEVLDINICNTTTAGVDCSLHFVPSGSSAATTNAMFKDMRVPANTTIQWTGMQVLNAGDFIQGIGSASGLTVTVSGNEVRAGT